MKRENYISWDEFFMGIAELAAKRSKDPRTSNGVCIVNKENRIVSVGYNGLPDGMSDDSFFWDTDEKYSYVVHAELNAILNAKKDLSNNILYLYSERGYYPCTNGCSQAIVQSGIKEVVLKFLGDTKTMKDSYNGNATKRMFAAAGIRIRVMEEGK